MGTGQNWESVTAREHLEKVFAEYRLIPALSPLAHGGVFVGPSGPLNAPFAIVGEAPGETETRQGRPFVGAAGQKLTAMMARAGLNRSLAYITNVVKFRPPGNRTPFPYEIAASRGCLFAEMAIVSPVLVVTMGSVALRAFFPDETMRSAEGKLAAWHDPLGFSCFVLPLFHPAFTFHSAGAEERIVRGLRTITGKVNEGD